MASFVNSSLPAEYSPPQAQKEQTEQKPPQRRSHLS
jgi:hypothetical protein